MDALDKARRTVVVVSLSSSAVPRPPIVTPMASAGAGSVAVCDQIRAVDKSRLVERAGSVSPADMKTLAESVAIVLGL